MMKRFIAIMCFLIIASICFTGYVIATAISAGWEGQSEVGYSLLIISGLCLAAVVFITLWMERDYQYKKKEAEGA